MNISNFTYTVILFFTLYYSSVIGQSSSPVEENAKLRAKISTQVNNQNGNSSI